MTESRCEQSPGMCHRDVNCPDTACPGRQQALAYQMHRLTPPDTLDEAKKRGFLRTDAAPRSPSEAETESEIELVTKAVLIAFGITAAVAAIVAAYLEVFPAEIPF